MKRYAAHRIEYNQQTYNLCYAELTDEGFLTGIYPFTEELADTTFFNGTLRLVSTSELRTDHSGSNSHIERLSTRPPIGIIRYK